MLSSGGAAAVSVWSSGLWFGIEFVFEFGLCLDLTVLGFCLQGRGGAFLLSCGLGFGLWIGLEFGLECCCGGRLFMGMC